MFLKESFGLPGYAFPRTVSLLPCKFDDLLFVGRQIIIPVKTGKQVTAHNSSALGGRLSLIQINIFSRAEKACRNVIFVSGILQNNLPGIAGRGRRRNHRIGIKQRKIPVIYSGKPAVRVGGYQVRQRDCGTPSDEVVGTVYQPGKVIKIRVYEGWIRFADQADNPAAAEFQRTPVRLHGFCDPAYSTGSMLL